MSLNKELKARWKSYVESYGNDTSKRIHLISATHVVNRIIDTATSNKEEMTRLICRKCNTEQDMIKRIICEGTSKECFCWWCPKCKDQIADSATSNVHKTKCKLSINGQCGGNFSPLKCDGIDYPKECSEFHKKAKEIVK